MTERLQKILACRGIASRRRAEELIAAGRVSCNGETAWLGQSADPDRDEILLDGEPIPSRPRFVYIMLNKPRGYVTTLSDEKGRRNAAQLVDCGVRVYPVGRLDMDSEGLLLFTNDGDFANAMMHPRREVSKIYEVWVRGYTLGAERRLERPITLDGYTIRPPQVRLCRAEDDRARFQIIIHEGRNRQIRRMCQAAGMQVVRLCRVAEGNLRLGNLETGKWRYLSKNEVENIHNPGGG